MHRARCKTESGPRLYNNRHTPVCWASVNTSYDWLSIKSGTNAMYYIILTYYTTLYCARVQHLQSVSAHTIRLTLAPDYSTRAAVCSSVTRVSALHIILCIYYCYCYIVYTMRIRTGKTTQYARTEDWISRPSPMPMLILARPLFV